MPPNRQIRATYTDCTIRVYQAFNRGISEAAVTTGKFGPPFKTGRMTWIKPSFCWMAYRSGYSYKDVNQERILAIDLTRQGFENLLDAAVLSTQSETGCSTDRQSTLVASTSDVVVQWDPERDIQLNRMDYRAIQVGIRGRCLNSYADGDQILQISDVTSVFRDVRRLLDEGRTDDARHLLPEEREYPVTEFIANRLGMPETRSN
jgi:Domain of unknown function (DUF4291)